MCDCCDDNLTNLNTGNDGQSAFLYIIYADDLIGTDAQLTVPTCFQAFVNSNVSMTNQEAIDYAIDNDLFYDRCGDSGGSGSQGPQGPPGPKGDPGDPACNPLAEISLRFDGGEEEDLVINFVQDGTECEQTFTGTILPGNFAASSFFAEVTQSTEFETVISNSLSSTINSSFVSLSYTTIGTTNSNHVYLISTTGDIPSLYPSGPSWSNYIQAYKIGKLAVVSFRLALYQGGNSTAQEIYLKLPGGIQSAETGAYAGIGLFELSSLEALGLANLRKNPVVTTNTNNNTFISIQYENPANNYPIYQLENSNEKITISGQIIFKTV